MKTEIGPGQFECAVCHGVFDKDWSDEEAKAELEQRFPGHEIETCMPVCDDCDEKLTAWMREKGITIGK